MRIIYHDQDNQTLCIIETDNPEWIISAATESRIIWLKNNPYTYDAMYLRHDEEGSGIQSSLHIYVNIDTSEGTKRAAI